MPNCLLILRFLVKDKIIVAGRKVFSRKGNFLARDVDPPMGDLINVPVSDQIEASSDAELETSCYRAKNVKVRVLKPDADFIRKISKRLSCLDDSVSKLIDISRSED